MGRYKLKPVANRVESDWIQRLQLTHDKLLSSFAFKCNLHHYSSVKWARQCGCLTPSCIPCQDSECCV